MPSCHCQSRGCGGQDRTTKVFNKHKADDHRRKYLLAQEQRKISEAVLAEQDAELAAFVASLTLSKTTDETSSDTASSLAPQIPPKMSRTPHLDSLNQINAVKSDLEALEQTVLSRLDQLSPPTRRIQPFPLASLQAEVTTLRNRLNRVHLNEKDIRERKEAVTKSVKALKRCLDDRQNRWNADTDRIPEKQPTIPVYNTDHHFEPILEGVHEIVQLIMFAMTVLDVVLNLSRRGCHFFLSFARLLLQLAFTKDWKDISPQNAAFVNSLPADPDTVTSKFPLDGKATIHAVCPNKKCHKTYPPTFLPDNPVPQYPKFCTHQVDEDGPACGTAITRKHKTGTIQVAIKRFVSFSFKDFVARLVSRKGMENLMDEPTLSAIQGELKDVFDGEFLKALTDYKGVPFQSIFDVGRYSFSLGVDFFNPHGNKQAGKKVSVGVLTVVCLNLPIHLRYKTENMFLAGVIPGPSEPPLDAINHYFAPLVDEFLEFWNPGVRFSQTPEFPDGRLILCALILIICDLPAARKTAGFASFHQEHFCSMCHCCRSREGYSSTDFHTWQRRTNEECRADAERYRNASDDAERLKVFNATGMRWSELLRLPYLDISRCLVVDSMHNLFLGLLKTHFVNILGIGLPERREQPALNLPTTLDLHDLTGSDRKGVKRLKKLLQAPVKSTLPNRTEAIKKLTSNVTSPALKFVSTQLRSVPPGHDVSKLVKADLAGYLFEWRVRQREYTIDTTAEHGHILTEEDMQEIWDDLAKIVTPSWMTSVPSNLGTSGTGKLKADQWRVLGTVHLPLSLTRIWGNVDPDDAQMVRRRKILDVTNSLLSAVRVATSHTITAADAETYLQYMLEYLEGIKELFPNYSLLPNHHMSLHIYDFLLLFGPVHSWWTYPFERLIGVLQRMPHNFQIGQYEETMATSYTRASNLRAILQREGCPEVIHKFEDAFQQVISPQNTNSMETMMRALPSLSNITVPVAPAGRKQQNLPADVVNAFRQAEIQAPASGYILSDVSVRGVTFSVASKHLGNSCIIVTSGHRVRAPAQIRNIIQFEDNKVFFMVRYHESTSWRNDIYDRYRGIGGKLWSPRFGAVELIAVDKVVGHFAYLPVIKATEDAIAVLPLWRGA